MADRKFVRPFSIAAKVYCRSYSRPLQRIITDFGADISFQEAAEKIQEHHGIEVPPSSIRKITTAHANQFSTFSSKESKKDASIIISEMDGSMVPIVEMGEGQDLRKTRKTLWKEAKLCFAKVNGSIDRKYGAVIGSPSEAGRLLHECVKRSGLTDHTHIHALGDGAQWIVDQYDEQFGNQVSYFVDFFHTCEYLSEAAMWCNATNSQSWLEEKKTMLKEGKEQEVIEELQRKLQQIDSQEETGLHRCVRYVEKRIGYMNYQKAREAELPIGSGEIESSHRHVVQKRLKIAGAWWKTENANAMLQLRTARANGYWKEYWESKMAT